MKPLTTAEYLKVSTKEAHHQTERAANSQAIMKGSISKEDYLMILRANYQVWQGVEEQLNNILPPQERTSPSWATYHLRFTPYLLQDLQQLDENSQNFDDARKEIDLPNEAAILGALYVLNGSTLGGKYLYQALLKNSNLTGLSGFHFYQACSEMPPEHWPGFRAYLNETLVSPEQREQAKEVAINIFQKFTLAYQSIGFSAKIT